MTTTAAEIVSLAGRAGIRAQAWSKGERARIYAETGRRDLSVYLELDGSLDDVTGAALKVFCSTPQHPNWIKAQIAQAKVRFAPLFLAYAAAHYADTPAAPNGYGPDINGMIDEAREWLASLDAEDDD